MTTRLDPAASHYFALEIDGIEVAHFLECSGLRSSSSMFEIEEGGLNDRVHRFVGAPSWDPVTLRVATQVSAALWSWRERCRAGEHAERLTGAITLYDISGEPMSRFELTEVWPVRWSGPDLDAEDSALAVEELEIAHEGIRVV